MCGKLLVSRKYGEIVSATKCAIKYVVVVVVAVAVAAATAAGGDGDAV